MLSVHHRVIQSECTESTIYFCGIYRIDLAKPVQSQDKREFCFEFCNFAVKFFFYCVNNLEFATFKF